MSFRLKTILSIALIESILLIVLVLSMINFLSESNEEQLQQRAAITSTLFVQSVKNAVLSTDLATLESIVENALATPDIVYVRISNKRFMLAEGGDLSSLNLSTNLDTELGKVTDGVFDTRFEIIEAGQVYGVVDMGLSTTAIESLLSQAQAWIIVIASIEVFLVIILSFLLGTFLTRQLQDFKVASENIAQQGPGLQIKVRGSDELADMARAFNKMSSTLASNYQQLSDSITSKNKMTEIAESNQAKNNAILEASLDALITINEQGNVLDYNQVAETIFGWTYDEIAGKNLADFIISPNKRHAHAKGMKQYLDTQQSPVINQRLELTATHKLGHPIPIEINIAPIKTEHGTLFTAFIRDISERLQAETELRLAAQTFESSEAIFICDANANIIRTNRAFSRITGYDNEDVLGQNPSILSSGQHPEGYYKNMWSSLLDNGKWNGEIYN
ncbi:MAG: PAS domain S-box protein, partial [Psychromonas sp.]